MEFYNNRIVKTNGESIAKHCFIYYMCKKYYDLRGVSSCIYGEMHIVKIVYLWLIYMCGVQYIYSLILNYKFAVPAALPNARSLSKGSITLAEFRQYKVSCLTV